MRRPLPVALLAALLLAACGGDGDEQGETGPPPPERTATATLTTEAPRAEGPLAFSDVEDFTLTTLGGDASVEEECEDLAWAEGDEEGAQLDFAGATGVEILLCDGVPYVFYLEYPDEETAEVNQASVQLTRLVVDGRIVVTPGVAVDEEAARSFLDALRAECGCGEIVSPGG